MTAAIHTLAVLVTAGIMLGALADSMFVLIRNRARIIAALRADQELDR